MLQIFHGYTNPTTPVKNPLEEPIRARFIRVTQTDVGYPAVSIELIGCRSKFLGFSNITEFQVQPPILFYYLVRL